jgi:hypothetical protein
VKNRLATTTVAALSAAAWILSGCASSPLIEFSLDTPAAALVPIRHAGIDDGRARFREIYCAVQRDHGPLLPDDRICEEVLHRLPDEPDPSNRPVHLGNARLPMRLVIVSGLFHECISGFADPFASARSHVESLGFRTELIMVGGFSGIEQNAAEIRDAIAAMVLAPDEQLVFVAYSKGAADLLEALVRYPDLAERTAAAVTLSGVISGSPIADATPRFAETLGEKIFFVKCAPSEGEAIESLSRSERLTWLASNDLPPSVRFYSLAAFADRENISHALRPFYDELAEVDPRNDGQVVFHDALVPGGTLLGYLNGDHWAVAIPFSREHPTLTAPFTTRNGFPREVLLEAVARFVEEELLQATEISPQAGPDP